MFIVTSKVGSVSEAVIACSRPFPSRSSCDPGRHIDLRQRMGDFSHAGARTRHVSRNDHPGGAATGQPGEVHAQLRRDLACIRAGLAASRRATGGTLQRRKSARRALGMGMCAGLSAACGATLWVSLILCSALMVTPVSLALAASSTMKAIG